MAISVVIPTVGRPELERAVASVGRQTRLPEELILVDNGTRPLPSTAILRELAGHACALRVVSLPPLSGPGICRNVGAWEAEGTHVAFLDDDDHFAEDYLDATVETIRAQDPDVAYATKVFHGPDGDVRYRRLSEHPSSQWYRRLFLHKNRAVGGSNVTARRSSFFDVGGFPPSMSSGQDRGFAMAALRAGLHVVPNDRAAVHCMDPAGTRASAARRLPPLLWLTAEHWAQFPRRDRALAVLRLTKVVVFPRRRPPSASGPRWSTEAPRSQDERP